MSSIIEAYNYDIFISYRQKDNRHDGWVTEFVNNLIGELESTFKEEVSVYFDINPHDGLLETHDVDESLKEKLKCLVFIPIISRTYCDPKSFAWEHEFKAFIDQASRDQYGLKIKLPNGNVASRVLPVKIYDLDEPDVKLCESVLGGVLRGVEFIYKSPGVNRPLRAAEDHPHDNLNKTYYRDQINKVGNAIKEIIGALGQEKQEEEEIKKETLKPISPPHKKRNAAVIAVSVIALAVIVLGIIFIPELNKPGEPVDKSIAVLPFKNMSNDPDQDYFCDGIMEEILNHLFLIEGLKIPSSTSSMRFKGSDLSIKEIARKLEVSYVLEGRVSRSGDKVRIIVRLVNGQNEKLLWTKDYNRTMVATELFSIQSDVAQQVADNLKVVIDPEVKKKIENIPTRNTEAYNLFLKALNLNLTFDEGRTMLERAISLDPQFADAHSLLAIYWIFAGGHGGNLKREQVLEKAEPLLAQALQLNESSILTHYTIAILRLYYYWDFETAGKEFMIVNQLDLSNTYVYDAHCDYLLSIGEFREAFNLTKYNFELNKTSPGHWVTMVLAYYYNEQQGKALETLETAQRIFPDDSFIFINSIRLFTYLGKYKEGIELFGKGHGEEKPGTTIPYYWGHLGIAYFKTGDKNKSEEYLNKLLSKSKVTPVGSPSFFAAGIYTAMGENGKALQLLEKAFSDREVEMYWLKVEPLFKPLHGDPRFEKLLVKIGFDN